jgi:hypothetical protein
MRHMEDFVLPEPLHPKVVEALRRMTPGQRMLRALQANDLVRVMIRATLRSQHPEWDEARVNWELVRRVLGDQARLIEHFHKM